MAVSGTIGRRLDVAIPRAHHVAHSARKVNTILAKRLER